MLQIGMEQVYRTSSKESSVYGATRRLAKPVVRAQIPRPLKTKRWLVSLGALNPASVALSA